MKKILVAVDIEREGGNTGVMKTAKTISSAMSGSLALLHVMEPSPGYVISQIPNAILEKRKSDAEQELRELAKQYGITDIVLREGAPATEIIEYANEIGADLIILDSHDPDLSNYFIGSVASRVVRHAHCSVHVVRRASKEA